MPPLIDEDHITQAVIARHASVADARLRDVMTSLVQHLHAFVRDVRLTEAEWRAGLWFLAEAGGASITPGARGEARAAAHAPHAADAARDAQTLEAPDDLARLSEALGLTALVAALGQRSPHAAERPLSSVPRGHLALATSTPGERPVARLLRTLGHDA